MKLKIFSFSAAIQIVFILTASAAPRTVAVLNFANHTGGMGLQYLSKAMPESIAATLTQSKEIRVVEREQLGKLLNEIALEQTGILDVNQVSRAGKMAQADVLILGSYSGNPDNIILSLKAVDVVSAKVIDGKVVKAPLATIFDRANEAALAMAALIGGKNLGFLSISSTPDNAVVYVDGMEIGKTPLVDYKLPVGEHQVKVLKSEYLETETAITITADQHSQLNPFLAKNIVSDRWQLGLNLLYFIPADKNLTPGPLFILSAGHSFDIFILSGEFGYSKINHNQTFLSPFGVDITQERNYSIFMMHGSMDAAPFRWKNIQPYSGVFGGWTRVDDYRKVVKSSDERLMTADLFTCGVKAGANILPFSSVSLFAEARYYFTPSKITRKVYSSQGLLGDLKSEDTKVSLNAYSIGGGIKFFF